MNNTDITEIPTAAFCGRDIDCGCYLSRHSVGIKDIFLGENALNMLAPSLKKLFPIGRVLFITCEDVYLAAGKQAVSKLKDSGYAVSVHVLASGAAPDPSVCVNFTKEPENVRAIVSFGSGTVTDIAKYYSYLSGLPLIAVITAPSALGCANSFSALYKKGVLTYYLSTAPTTLICDLKIMRAAPRHLIAAGYGGVMAALTLLSDLKFARFIYGIPVCMPLTALISQCVDFAQQAGETLLRGEGSGIDLLSEAVIRYSLALNMLSAAHRNRPVCGMQQSAAHVLDAACRVGKEPKRIQSGAAALIMSGYILKIYSHYLSTSHRDLLLPADRAAHADAISGLSGMSGQEALELLSSAEDLEQLELSGYKLKEFSADLCRYNANLASRCDAALKVFRRIYNDAGYWLNGFFNDKQLKSAIALAPAFDGGLPALLSFMRDAGYFEHYIDEIGGLRREPA